MPSSSNSGRSTLEGPFEATSPNIFFNYVNKETKAEREETCPQSRSELVPIMLHCLLCRPLCGPGVSGNLPLVPLTPELPVSPALTGLCLPPHPLLSHPFCWPRRELSQRAETYRLPAPLPALTLASCSRFSFPRGCPGVLLTKAWLPEQPLQSSQPTTHCPLPSLQPCSNTSLLQTSVPFPTVPHFLEHRLASSKTQLQCPLLQEPFPTP